MVILIRYDFKYKTIYDIYYKYKLLIYINYQLLKNKIKIKL